MLRTALKLAGKGVRIFPCLPRQKVPATPHGCLDATTDSEVIRGWWRERPACNIAIATGTASDVFVVDVDGLDAECALRKLEAENGALPPTVEAITARGRHLYFKMPEMPVRNSAGKIAPGVDVRGDGGYVICATKCSSERPRLCVERRQRQRIGGGARLAARQDHRAR